MNCPKCKGKGFRPTPVFSQCTYVRKTDTFPSLIVRYYHCVNDGCGCKFKTSETITEEYGAVDLFSLTLPSPAPKESLREGRGKEEKESLREGRGPEGVPSAEGRKSDK